jgi:ubiquinone/menaquinone biosynthesis C-methylase UbiE
MPIEHKPDENNYFIDAESATEMARLINQDRLFTENMGGLFPERNDVSSMHDILDIACGPGGWVLDVATAFPEIRAVGIDISHMMIEYARAQAWSKGLNNASFQFMNALEPLEFADDSFDMVNARSIFGFMPTTAWPGLIQECMRITRPGGIIRLTEFDTYGTTNSPAVEKINEIGLRAFKLAGMSFSPDGRSLGITPMLGRFLRDAGCINIQRKAHAFDFSMGTVAHEAMYNNSQVVFKMSQPFMVKMKVATQEELDMLYRQASGEMMSDDFCGVWFYLSAWGEKAVSTSH